MTTIYVSDIPFIAFMMSVLSVSVAIPISLLQNAQLNINSSRKNKIAYISIFSLIHLILEVSLILVGYFISVELISSKYSNLVFAIIEIACICFLNIIWYSEFRKKNLLKLIGVTFISYFLQDNFSMLAQTAEEWFYPKLGIFGGLDYQRDTLIRMFTPPVLTLIFSYLIVFLMKKLNFSIFIDFIFENKKRSTISTFLFLILSLMNDSMALVFTFLEETSFFKILSLFVFTVLVFLMFSFAIHQTNKDKLESQKMLYEQQNSYIHSLEQMQQEMRFIKHDFENMMTGIYIQASEGDTAGVKEYLQETLHYFDKKIGKELKVHTQLSNIEIMPLKSLILAKCQELKDLEIDVRLEVYNPIKGVSMDINDLLRCIGILIDNAKEETVKLDQRYISIVLFCEEGKNLLVSINNPVQDIPVLHKIYQKGFSSKGENRGFGLASYREITKLYSNIFANTSCKDGVFSQTLEIKEVN